MNRGTPAEKQIAIEMRRGGATQVEIAAALGRCQMWVSKTLRNDGDTIDQRRKSPTARLKSSDFRPASHQLQTA
jgi:transcriptional regulator